MNPKLKVGDEIVLYHMEGDFSVPPGTVGEVWKIVHDPFVKDSQIIHVRWENGSTLNLLSDTDSWKKVKKDITEQNDNSIDQSHDPYGSWIEKNMNIRRAFNLNYLGEYLELLRESGIVNMYGASPLLYAGANHIERYYGEGREDNEKFQELLSQSDKAKDVFINGLLKWMGLEGIDINDLSRVNTYADRISKKILQYWILFHG